MREQTRDYAVRRDELQAPPHGDRPWFWRTAREPKKEFAADPATDLFTSAGHGLADGAHVMVDTARSPFTTSDALPGGLFNTLVYYVRGATADTFQLAKAPGWPAIDVTSAGSGVHWWARYPAPGQPVSVYFCERLRVTHAGGVIFQAVHRGPLSEFTADATTNTLTSEAHGLAAGQRIALQKGPELGAALPGGLAADTSYYVVNPTADTFQVARVEGGTPIDLTDAGSGTHTWGRATSDYVFDLVSEHYLSELSALLAVRHNGQWYTADGLRVEG
ncbi:MAG: hypothetical protein KY476_00625 [Planctomycetes bacterium]|nr:hypothetical protein [Planctomycetota bacterium]